MVCKIIFSLNAVQTKFKLFYSILDIQHKQMTLFHNFNKFNK